MQPGLQRIEREGVADWNGELAIDNKPCGRKCGKLRDNLWKIARQSFARLGSKLDFIAGAKRHASKAVPLWFELPSRLARQFTHEPRFHRTRREWYRQPGDSFAVRFSRCTRQNSLRPDFAQSFDRVRKWPLPVAVLLP